MKFAHHLAAHITPEWRKQYIQYDEMKEILYSKIGSVPSNAEARGKFISIFEEEFFDFCSQELEKINLFFKEKLAEASRKWISLKAQLQYLVVDSNNQLKIFRLNKHGRKRNAVKLAFSEYYLGLVLLQNYQTLNYTGFRKILKKHDKLFDLTNGKSWMTTRVETALFYSDHTVNELINDTEDLVTNELEAGDRAKAMKKLRVPPLQKTASTGTTFFLGLFTGVFVMLVIKICFGIQQNVDNVVFDWHTLIRFYRAPFILNLFIFLIGLNIYGWRRNGVNHVLIFELNPRDHLGEQHFMEIAAFLSCVWGWSLYLTLYAKTTGIPLYSSPLGLFVFYVAFLFNPTKTFWSASRLWLIKRLFRILTMPFHRVQFADFWIADQISSLTPVFLDFQYIICFYLFSDNVFQAQVATSQDCLTTCRCNDPTMFIRPLIRCIPGWLRLIQCLRRCKDTKDPSQITQHLYNAVKYASTFFVIIFSTLHAVFKSSHPDPSSFLSDPFLYFWILSSVLTSCYSYYWDVKMDWGLFDSNCGDNKYLREEIVYNNKSFYYFAIVEDCILRFSWAVSLSLTEMGYVPSDYMITVLAPLELFRRFIWNFFRLENEHLNNVGQFRAVRDISIVPLKNWNINEKTELLAAMDEEDGEENLRRKSKSSIGSSQIRIVSKPCGSGCFVNLNSPHSVQTA